MTRWVAKIFANPIIPLELALKGRVYNEGAKTGRVVQQQLQRICAIRGTLVIQVFRSCFDSLIFLELGATGALENPEGKYPVFLRVRSPRVLPLLRCRGRDAK